MSTRIIRIALVVLLSVSLVVPGLYVYYEYFANPRIIRELSDDPDGERARRVMAITLPSGRRIPVNYLREGDRVYAAADGSWWQELEGDGFAVTVLVRGETLTGVGRAVLDDLDHIEDVFSRLRPNAVPGFGTLVEVRIHEVVAQ